MPSRLVKMPQGEETVIISPDMLSDGESPLILDFDPRDVAISQTDNDLVFIGPDGGRLVIENYYSIPDAPVPVFLSGDTEIPGDDIIPLSLAPAAGPDAAPQILADGGRFADYAQDGILHGIQSLGGLPVAGKDASVADNIRHDVIAYPAYPHDVAGAASQLTGTVEGNNTPLPPHVNTPPTVASAVAGPVTEDVTLSTSGVLPAPQDVDTGNSPVFIPKAHEAGQYGTLTLDAGGHYTYTLNNASQDVQALGAEATAYDIFTYTVADGHGGTAQNTLTVTIQGSNDAPTVASAVAGPVREDVTLTASGVLPAPQDVDAGDSPVFIPKAHEAGQYGTLTLDAGGHYTYTLNNASQNVQALGAGATAYDTFTYTVADGHGGTAQNTLTVTIQGSNDAPTVASAVASPVQEDVTLTASGVLPTPQDIDTGDVPVFIPKADEMGQYGSLTLDASGHYTYTLNNASQNVQALGAGATAHDIFTYTVSDGHGGTAQNTLTVTIQGTNDAPTVASAVASPVKEDVTLSTSGVLPAPHDIDTGDVPVFIPKADEMGQYGSLTLDASGHYTYTLNNASQNVQALGAGATAHDIFTYTVSDGHGGTAQNTLTVTIQGTNDAPTVASAVASPVKEDVTLSTSGVLPTPHDIDTGDSPVFIPKAHEAGQYGTLTLDASGHYTYVLNNTSQNVQALGAGATAHDIFTYTVSDGHGGTAQNTLTVTIQGSNDAPTVASAVANPVREDVTLTASGVLPTPQDVDTGDVPVFIPKTHEAGQYGTLTLDAGGHYTYTLNNASQNVQALGAGATAYDTFTYTVNDGHGGTAQNTLTVTIQGSNDAPTVASAVASPVREDVTLSTSGVLPAPQDIDTGDVPAFIPKAHEAGQYGTLTLDAAGNYTYTLNNASSAVQSLGAGATAYDTFTYTVSDGHGGTAQNTLTVTIQGSNDAPTVASAVASPVREDVTLTASGVLPAPQDIDTGDAPAFIPKAHEAGQYGSLTLDAGGHYTYTLNNASQNVQALGAGATAYDVFTYTVSDGHGGTAQNTLTVTIQGSNDAPTVASAIASPVREDVTLTTSGVLPTPHDIDTGDNPVFIPKAHEAGQYGTLTLDAAGHYTYTLNNASQNVQALGAGATVYDIFTYTVADGHGGTTSTGQNTLTITIQGSNDAPTVASAVASPVREDVTLSTSGVLPTPQDVDTGDVPVFIPKAHEAGQYGTLTLDASGHYTYTLNNASQNVQALGAGATAHDIFTYTVSDGHGGTAQNTLTVTIQGSNDAPTVASAVASPVREDVTLSTSGVLPAPQDIDTGDVPIFIPKAHEVGQYGTLTLDAGGHYTYTLNNASQNVQALGAGATAYDTFTYTVSDGRGGTAQNTLTVTIQGSNDAPTVASAVASPVKEDVTLATSGVLPAPQDIDTGDVPIFIPKAHEVGQYGTLTLDAGGHYTYTLNNASQNVQALGAGATAYDTFTYTVSDGHGGTAQNTLTVTIQGSNDAPTVGAATESMCKTTNMIRDVLPTPHDIDTGDTVSFALQPHTVGKYGFLHLNTDGSYFYNLDNNMPAVAKLPPKGTLTETFTYTVTDNHGATTQNTLTITITGAHTSERGASLSDLLHSTDSLDNLLSSITSAQTGKSAQQSSDEKSGQSEQSEQKGHGESGACATSHADFASNEDLQHAISQEVVKHG